MIKSLRSDNFADDAVFTRPFAAALAVLCVGLIALITVRFERTHGLIARQPPLVFDHTEAAARQQGVPTSAAEAKALIEHDLAIARSRDASSTAWSDSAAVGDLLLARARLTGSFGDYAEAGRAYQSAFALAAPGTGPHLERASWNFAVHRLGVVAPDLAVIERYAVPDDAVTAAVLGLRGDLAFYSGRYSEALALYNRAQARMPTLGGDMRLANYYARFGKPEVALALLDQADARMTGPQQQLRAYIELRRGIVELARGRWDAAERHFARADAIFPGYWLVEEQLATIHALRGDLPGALAIFRRMATRDNSPDAFDGIAGLYRGAGELGQAQAWAGKAGAEWERRLALLPEAALGHALDHLLAFGDPARALEVARRNYTLRPYGDSATGLAWAWLYNHRPAEALAAIRPTLDAGWNSAEAHVVASEAHALLGQGKEADAERAAALAINPHALDRNPGMTWLEQ